MGQAVLIDVLANDRDADGDRLTIADSGRPSNGTSKIQDGKILYTPDANFSGTEVWTYGMNDGKDADRATITVTVVKVNQAPRARDDGPIIVQMGGEVVIDVFANDNDGDDDDVTIEVMEGPAHGKVSVLSSSNVRYTHNGTAGNSSDVFTYRLVDEHGAKSTIARVTMDVNHDPWAEDDSEFTNDDAPVTFNVITEGSPDSDPDGDPLTLVSPTGTITLSNGAGTLKCNANGSCTWDPPDVCYAQATTTYRISDGRGGTDSATIRVTIDQGCIT